MGISFTGVRAAMKATLGAVFPPQCPGCGTSIADEGGLCPSCWRETEFIASTCCDLCGSPMPGDGSASADAAALHCDDCILTPRPWARGRAALVYAGMGRQMTMGFKHGDRVDLAPILGGWVARAAEPLALPGTIVVPVPIHPLRLMKRKYNQAALLARQVARGHDLRHQPGILTRTRHTPMQDHGTVSDRVANVDGVFSVPARMHAAVQGQPILLVDDVMASGATLAEASRALIQAGSGPVQIVVLARAIKTSSATSAR